MDRLGKGLKSRFLRVESLESRALLAGHSAAGSIGLGIAMTHHPDLPPAVAAHVASPVAGANVTAAASQQTVLTAHLTDSTAGSTAIGTAVWHSGTVQGTARSQLNVEIEHALADTTYDVSIGGNTFTLTTDANGTGELTLFSNPKGDQHGLPAGFTITSGDTLTVTAEGSTSDTLSGSFASPKPVAPQVVNLKATLTDSQGGTAKGTASYQSVTRNGTTHSSLQIAMTGAAPGSTLDVTVTSGANTVTLGTIKINARGRGVLHVTDPSVTIASGDVISVGTLGGTFSTVGKKK